jgi:ribosomal protein S7
MTKQKKTIEIKNKFINHLTIKGKKSQSEKIIYKTLKALQKTSKKPLKKLIQLALVANAPVFKLNTITKKKERKKNKNRVSFQLLFPIKLLESLLQLNLL